MQELLENAAAIAVHAHYVMLQLFYLPLQFLWLLFRKRCLQHLLRRNNVLLRVLDKTNRQRRVPFATGCICDQWLWRLNRCLPRLMRHINVLTRVLDKTNGQRRFPFADGCITEQ